MNARSSLLAVLVAGMTLGPAAADTVKNPLAPSETWDDLQYDVIGDAQPVIGDDVISVEAPFRAHDAATVPIHIAQTDMSADIQAITLVVDENPAPVVAEIKLSDAMLPLDFETRVRVNQYSNIRAIAQRGDGELVMSGRFVKASGGCSAPATKDPEIALASMGRMKLRLFGDLPIQSGIRREAQIMIRHPNYSGLQRDQITQLFVPAHFINTLEVRQGDQMLFSLEGGISISENPVFRFKYTDNGSEAFRIIATDTDGNVFDMSLPKSAAS